MRFKKNRDREREGGRGALQFFVIFLTVPKCTKIDPFSHCYVADSSCRKNTT